MEQEAHHLTKRFEGVKNRAKFASDNSIPGGGSMVYQHMRGYRPIGLEAAKAYAKAFNCPLEEISPRLAQEITSAMAVTGEQARGSFSTNKLVFEDKEWDALSPLARKFIKEIISRATTKSLSDEGIMALLALSEQLSLMGKKAIQATTPAPNKEQLSIPGSAGPLKPPASASGGRSSHLPAYKGGNTKTRKKA